MAGFSEVPYPFPLIMPLCMSVTFGIYDLPLRLLQCDSDRDWNTNYKSTVLWRRVV